MHPACDKYLQVLWPTHDLLILIISLSGETQVESWLDAFCHDFRCCSSVKWWVIKRDSGPDRETSSRAELLCRMQQAAGVCFVQKAAWWRFNPDTDLKKRCFYWHWMEADRPLKHQTENVKKKKTKETLWTFISWRKLFKLKTSKAIPGRETLRKNILGFGHTPKKKSWNVSWVIRNNQLGDKKPTQSCVYTYIWHCLSITITHTGN